jgi:amino acid adenylation domain-containing protein
MFVLQNTPEVPQLRLGEVQLSGEAFAHNTSKFDLTFSITATTHGMQGVVEYSTDLYTEQTIMRMLAHFKELLTSIVKEPEQRIRALPMLSKIEEQQLLVEFNDNNVEYPKHKSVVDLFEQQVAKTPQAIALVFGDGQMSYRELDERSNQLANYLLDKGIKPGSNIGLLSLRGIEMIAGMLGILKAGCAYVPFNTQYPAERLQYIIEDAAIKVIVSTGKELVKASGLEGYTCIDLKESLLSSRQATGVKTGPDSRIYIMYTSGTTGRPKGIAVSNRNVLKLVYEPGEITVRQQDRVLQWSNYSFDGSVYDIYSSLLLGASLHLIKDDWVSDVNELSRVITEQKITVCFITTALFNSFIDINPDALKGLRKILFGGEMVSPSHVRRALSVLGAEKMVHVYGPTETTVYATYYAVDRVNEQGIIPIGKPLSNTKALLLNRNGDLVPLGVPGELYIGGDGVSLGYVNNQELSAEKFVAHPLSENSKERFYRTGDLARWLPDGNIEYLGRIDDQVKIRGYRIEPAEIESVLIQSGLVSQGVVLAREDNQGNKRLVGYVISNGVFSKEAIVTNLKTKLPDYMVPLLWIELESLPLTPNGKIDKKALPDPDASELRSHEYVAPRNELEARLAQIWKEILKLERVGIHDNFFELGGDSIITLQVVHRAKRLGYILQPKDLFIHQTIDGLATVITERTRRSALGHQDSLPEATKEERFMIPIKAEGTKIPFFAVIGFSAYSRLGPYVIKDQPLYYLQPPSSYNNVEEIASYYISEMKLLQPSGPYHIGGYCGGGIIAHEMAHQLVANGDEVSILVLIEYYSLRARLSKSSLRYIKRRLLYYKNRFISLYHSEPSRFDLMKFIIKKSYNGLIKKLNRHRRTNNTRGSEINTSPAKPQINTSPAQPYRAKPYSGKVTLFKASIPPLEMTDAPLMGWSDYFTGEVETIIINGGHLGIFKEPGVIQLADQLSTVLEKANEK